MDRMITAQCEHEVRAGGSNSVRCGWKLFARQSVNHNPQTCSFVRWPGPLGIRRYCHPFGLAGSEFGLHLEAEAQSNRQFRCSNLTLFLTCLVCQATSQYLSLEPKPLLSEIYSRSCGVFDQQLFRGTLAVASVLVSSFGHGVQFSFRKGSEDILVNRLAALSGQHFHRETKRVSRF